ncbi:PREDICTED: WAT1-related protein At1g68170-like [Prunus mume]|uniref:WAT1-related protein n=1 Tax=Prunus mume TaxID=102107 RepID=A0ABM1LVT5_PRUMU|nr:PREDICTED: WAT1-related protein At1g68170-like [Prunus mume]
MSLSSYYLYIRYIFFRKTSSIILGKVKIIGIVMGIGGAMVFGSYKGKEINMWSTHVDLFHTHGEPYKASHKSPQSLLWGCMLSLGGCVSYALWFIVQNFSYPYSSTALMSLMASIQSVVLAYCVDRDWKQWKLGTLISGFALILMTWGVKKKGPFFASVFQPVLLVMFALAGSFLLDEKLHMGSILGGLLIVAGLYAKLWANGKDKFDSQPTSAEEMPIHTNIAQA